MESMNVKDGARHLKFRLKHDFLTVENVVLVLAIGLCLIWTYQSVAAMSRNWELSETLTREKRELELLNVEVEAQALENEYYKTAEYQELMARKLLDKQYAGEHLVVMPENSEAAKTKHQVVEKTTQNAERSNVEQWLTYLFPSF